MRLSLMDPKELGVLDMPSGPRRGVRMTCTFRLVTVDGAPADLPSLTTVAPKWELGTRSRSVEGRCR
jgi:hypothetical protein